MDYTIIFSGKDSFAVVGHKDNCDQFEYRARAIIKDGDLSLHSTHTDLDSDFECNQFLIDHELEIKKQVASRL